MTSLGIDIGGTSVKLATVEDGELRWTARSARYNRPSRDELLSALRTAAGRKIGAVEAVGLCVPGVLDEQRQSVALSVNLPGLIGVPLAELVARVIGTAPARPLVVVSDVNATAYDLYATRKPAGRLLVLALGSGVGSAVL